MKNNIKAVEQGAAGIAGGNGYSEDISAPRFTADFECIGADGLPKWRTKFKNVVVDQGKGLLINRAFGFASNSSQIWYMGLHSGTNTTNSTAVISGAGSQGATASEVGNYGANRPSITFGSVYTTGQATATASYGFTAGTQTVSGAFIACGVQGTGVTAGGYLYSFGGFAASRQVQSNDTLNVTVSLNF